MPIKSYIVYPFEGKKDVLIDDLNEIKQCEVIPSKNKEIVAVVTCRFCGVGCGILVGVDKGKAVAVKGDPNSSVNKGLLCVKGYHQIMCIQAKDRLTHALVKKNGVYIKTPIDKALDIVANKMKTTIDTHGKDSVAIYTSGQSTIPGMF